MGMEGEKSIKGNGGACGDCGKQNLEEDFGFGRKLPQIEGKRERTSQERGVGKRKSEQMEACAYYMEGIHFLHLNSHVYYFFLYKFPLHPSHQTDGGMFKIPYFSFFLLFFFF